MYQQVSTSEPFDPIDDEPSDDPHLSHEPTTTTGNAGPSRVQE
jgi:hypothetical protein